MLGQRIEERLTGLGLSQSELARRAGVPVTTMNSIIRDSPRWSPHLVRIARELHTTVAYLTGETDDPDAEAGEAPEFTSDERDLLELMRGLAPKDRAAVLQLVRTIATSAPSSLVQFQRPAFKGKGKDG